MTIGPLLPGRLPDGLASQRLQSHLEVANRALARLQDQVATGQQFFTPSENPVGAIRTIELQTLIEQKTQFRANIADDTGRLATTESSLREIGDILNRASTLLQSGIGDLNSSEEKDALAFEVNTLIQRAVSVGNTKYRDEFIFAGSRVRQEPFAYDGQSRVTYSGDSLRFESRIDISFQIERSLDGISAFRSESTPISAPLDPALTLDTALSDLNGGGGVELGPISITLDNGTPQTAEIDLAGAETLQDIKTRIEDAFAAGPLTLTVDIDPVSNNGLRITPSAGTVSVSEVSGGRAASSLGIDSAAAAVVNGTDIDPVLTNSTPLAALNNGAGIGATVGFGLQIALDSETTVVDLSTAVTVEDALNAIRAVDPGLSAEISADGSGIEVTSRIGGVDLRIGENGGTNASGLGIRTLTGETRLDDLNRGRGVRTDDPLELTLSDGTAISVDLSTAETLQEVVDAVNAAAPLGLTASLNDFGNGLTLEDISGGAGVFTLTENTLTADLGLSAPVGTTIVGTDPFPIETGGVFDTLLRLETALRDENDAELNRLADLLDFEFDAHQTIRATVGARLRVLDETQNRLLDEDVVLQESLSEVFDADLTQVVTQVASAQASIEATLRLASSSFQLSLVNFL